MRLILENTQTQLISTHKLDDPDRSDIDTETNKTNPIKDASDRQIIEPQGKSRLVCIEGQGRTTPRTEKLVQLIFAEKMQALDRSKKELQEFFEVQQLVKMMTTPL